ncbi:MAG: TraB/GumN family protein [Gammaproteobacteria bacterium]|nr:TraB/GumN family protein [Gammaproteobacteria bacterium]
MFGSIHLGKEDLYPLSKTVQNAYSSSDYLVVEIDLKSGDDDFMLSLFRKDINAGKSLFVVVGSGHMVGTNGLVELLKKDSFVLKQIQ